MDWICTGCMDHTVSSRTAPEEPCPNCGYIDEKRQYEELDSRNLDNAYFHKDYDI